MGVCPGVDAEFDNCVAPGSGAENEPYVGDGMAEGCEVFWVFDVVSDGTTGPDGLFFEEALEEGYCFLDWFFERLYWRTGVSGFGGDFVVVAEKEGEDFGGFLGVYGCYFASWVGRLFDGWVLAVAFWVSICLLLVIRDIQVVEWDIIETERWRWDYIDI